MSPWIGNIIFLVFLIASIAIRVPHDKVRQETKVTESRKTLTEKILLLLMVIGMAMLPVLSFTPVLSFADFIPGPAAIAAGSAAALASLWLFYRSHKDLGRNWSPTLEIREGHALVSDGVYRYVRHPMYTSIFLMALAQLLLLANWVAAPALLVAFTFMFSSRLGTEEKMMLDRFGADYEAYRLRTKRLLPGIW